MFAFLRESAVADDVAGEARTVFAAIERRLTERGLSLADVGKTRILYTERPDYLEMNMVRDPLFRRTFRNDDFPCATGVVTGGNGGASPRLSIEVIACTRRRAGSSPEVIRQFGDVVPPFVHRNEVDGVVLVSGQGGFDLEGTLVGETPAEQARAAFATMAPILAGAGRDLSDVAAVTAYLVPSVCRGPDGEAVLAEMHAFLERCGGPAPVVTCIGVRDLAFEGMVVEVDVVAGPAGSRRIAQPASGATAIGPVPRASAVTSCGPLVLGSVTAEGGEDGSAIDAAVAELTGALDSIAVVPPMLLTAWHGAGVDGTALATAVTGRWPEAEVTIAPMRVHDGRQAVTVELMGQAGTPAVADV